MITDEEFDELIADLLDLPISALVDRYIREVEPNLTIRALNQRLSNNFNVPLIRRGYEFSAAREYEEQRQALSNYLFDVIFDHRFQQLEQQRLTPPPPPEQQPPEPTQQPPEVNWNRTFPNRPLSELDRLRLRNQELERENTRLKNYIHDRTMKDILNVQLKPIDKKEDDNNFIKQFVNSDVHERAMKDISDVKLKPIDKNELQEREDERLNDWRVVVNDERKQFKKSHHQMNFDEYKKATENSDKKINELKAYLNEDKATWLIEFDKIKPEALEANKQLFIDWWTEKIGTLTFANKFMIKFRVDGDWKTVPLNQDTYNQLLEKL